MSAFHVVTCPFYLNYFWRESFSCIVSSYGFGVWLRIVRCSELQCEVFRRERAPGVLSYCTNVDANPSNVLFPNSSVYSEIKSEICELGRGFHIYNCQSLRNVRQKSCESEFRNPLCRNPKKYPNKILYIMIPIVDLDVPKLQMWRRL